MDLAADSGKQNSYTTVGGPGLEQDLPLSSAGCQTESGGPLLLQLLEFKTHLFEAVEELHIRRDAETRFEDQISKLVLGKQELEWEKESLQHRIKTLENQHTESVTNVKKQFQAKIRNIEEEKGKYQVSAELKEKEINNLKEELRSLQLLKYNLENKSNELEQKLSLQSRLKDGHLNQLGEVEKRFSVLSRQCAMVKQAHEKLEQNVAESMRINKKLTSANEQQEATIVLLKKELEEMSSKLIKDKMTSVRHNRTDSHTGREQHMQKLQQKLNMETDMNVKLREENEAVRAEKQEVLRSLQCTQQLLLSQTQTVNTVELELQTQREQHQALKQEHEVMRDKSKTMGDKVAQLMERYAAFKTDWDKEKKTLQDCISCEQQDLRAVREAYDELHQKHAELSSVAKAQAQHICELEMKSSSQSLCVSTQVSSPNEPVCSSEPPGLVLQHSASSSHTRNPDVCLEDTGGAVTNLDATGATGGQEDLNHYQQSLNLFTCPLITNNLCSIGSDTSILTTSETDPGVVSDLIKTTSSSVSNNDLMTSEGDSVSGATCASSHEHKSEGATSEETNEGGNRRMAEKDDEGQEKRERNTEQQRNKDEVQGEDVEEGGRRGTDRQEEENQGSAEDAETERRDGAERGETGSEPAEKQIPTQTTEEKGDAQRVIDFTVAEPPLLACESSAALSQEVPDSCQTEERQSVNRGPDVSTDVQNLCHAEVQTRAAEPQSRLLSQAPEKTTEQKPTDESAAEFPVERSSFCSSQINVEPTQTHGSVSIQELETTTAQTAANDPSGVSSRSVKQTDEMSDKRVNEGCVELNLVPQSQDTSEQERGRLTSLVADDNDDDCGANKKSQGQSNDGDAVQDCVEKSNLSRVAVDVTMVTVDPESELESLGRQSRHRAKSDKIENTRAAESNNSETYLKPSVLQTGPRPLFSWPSVLHQFAQESEQNTSGRLRNLLSSTPMFSKSQQSKAPLVITRASDLLNASSVSGNAASSTRHQQGEWKALGETCRETVLSERMKLMDVELIDVPPTARQTKNERPVEENRANDAWESRASLSTITSPTVSTSSSAVSDPSSWTVTPGCSRAAGSASGPVSESEWELSCSQEREDQQSSFRAHISKIEQFLNTERLQLAKRRRIDN